MQKKPNPKEFSADNNDGIVALKEMDKVRELTTIVPVPHERSRVDKFQEYFVVAFIENWFA